MTTVHECPGCKHHTVLWDFLSGTFWCSNLKCLAGFARPSLASRSKSQPKITSEDLASLMITKTEKTA